MFLDDLGIQCCIQVNKALIRAIPMIWIKFAQFANLFAIPDVDPIAVTFCVLWGVLSLPLSLIAIRIFPKQAGEAVTGKPV